MAVLRSDFLPLNLQEIMAGTPVRGVISVQAQPSLKESEWLLEFASNYSFIFGVVAWAPLKEPHVDDILDRLVSHPKFKGAREILQG